MTSANFSALQDDARRTSLVYGVDEIPDSESEGETGLPLSTGGGVGTPCGGVASAREPNASPAGRQVSSPAPDHWDLGYGRGGAGVAREDHQLTGEGEASSYRVVRVLPVTPVHLDHDEFWN